jgi:alpha-N-arabinofuranosidase
LRPETISEQVNPSFVGRRQQHIAFLATVAMEFRPQSSNEVAGMVLTQNDGFHFRVVVTLNHAGSKIVRFIKRKDWKDSVLVEKEIQTERIYFLVEARGQDYSFFVAEQANQWQPLLSSVDGRILSTPVAGGFTGAYIGTYASSNGKPSQNYADFDWFEYHGI